MSEDSSTKLKKPQVDKKPPGGGKGQRPRVYVSMSAEVYDHILKLAKAEKRSASNMSAVLIENGLKQWQGNET